MPVEAAMAGAAAPGAREAPQAEMAAMVAIHRPAEAVAEATVVMVVTRRPCPMLETVVMVEMAATVPAAARADKVEMAMAQTEATGSVG